MLAIKRHFLSIKWGFSSILSFSLIWRRRIRGIIIPLDQDEESDSSKEYAVTEDNVSEDLDSEQLSLALKPFLSFLSERELEYLKILYEHDYDISKKDIAVLMGIKAPRVSQIIEQIRTKLIRFMKADHPWEIPD